MAIISIKDCVLRCSFIQEGGAPGVGEAAGGRLEPDDAAERRRHAHGPWNRAQNGTSSSVTYHSDPAATTERKKLKEARVLLLLPPPSAPRATGQSPAQTAAADPPEEPPETLPTL